MTAVALTKEQMLTELARGVALRREMQRRMDALTVLPEWVWRVWFH